MIPPLSGKNAWLGIRCAAIYFGPRCLSNASWRRWKPLQYPKCCGPIFLAQEYSHWRKCILSWNRPFAIFSNANVYLTLSLTRVSSRIFRLRAQSSQYFALKFSLDKVIHPGCNASKIWQYPTPSAHISTLLQSQSIISLSHWSSYSLPLVAIQIFDLTVRCPHTVQGTNSCAWFINLQIMLNIRACNYYLFLMSIFSQVSKDLFQEILTSIDNMTAQGPGIQRTQNSMIMEINMLAEGILDDSRRINSESEMFEDKPVLKFDVEAGTEQPRYFQGQQELSEIHDSDSSRKTSGVREKKTAKTYSENEGSLARIRISDDKNMSREVSQSKFHPSLFAKMHNVAFNRSIEKRASFIQNQANIKSKERSNSKTIHNSQLRHIEKVSNLKDSNIEVPSRVPIKKVIKISAIAMDHSKNTQKLEISKLTTSRQGTSTQSKRNSSIYDRGLEKINQKQKFIAEERKKLEVKEMQNSTFVPRVNTSLEKKKGFYERMSESTEKMKTNKAIIAQKEMAKTPFQPKIAATTRQVTSKVKEIWTKKPTTTLAKSKQELEPPQKSLNTTTDIGKGSVCLKDKTKDDKSRLISVKFSEDFDYLLRNT